MRLRLLAIPLVLSVALTGCGFGSKGAASSTTTSTTTNTGALAADLESGKALLLVQSDLPSGWIAGDSEPSASSDTAFTTSLNACQGLPPEAELVAGTVNGSKFTQGKNSIQSKVKVYKTAEGALKDKKTSQDPQFFPCLEKLFDKKYQDAAAEGVKIATSLSRLNNIATSESETALRATITAHSTKGNVVLYSDLLGYADGKFGATVSLTYIQSPPGLSFEQALMTSLKAHQTGSVSTPTPSSKNTTLDTANVKKLALVDNDVPAGWELESPGSVDPADQAAIDALLAKAAACMDLPEAKQVTAKVEANFVKDDDSIQSTGTFYTSDVFAKQDAANRVNAKYWPCLTKVYETELKTLTGASSEDINVSFSNLLGNETSNPNDRIVRLTASVTLGGANVRFYNDFFSYTNGRATSTVIMSYSTSDPSLDLDKSVMAAQKAHVLSATTS